MRKMTKRIMGILLLGVISIQANAGWFSGFRNIVNTIQNNVSGKVNKEVDNTTDKSKSKNKKTQSAASVDKSITEGKASETKTTNSTPSVYNGNPNIVNYTNERGNTIPFKNDYKLLDLGNDFKIYGERIFNKELEFGIEGIALEGFLAPGKYVVSVVTISFGNDGIVFAGKYQAQGIELGYGIIVRKTISYNKGRYTIKGDNDGVFYFVEVLEGTQGHLQAAMANSEKLDEHAAFTIYKVPEYPTLPRVK